MLTSLLGIILLQLLLLCGALGVLWVFLLMATMDVPFVRTNYVRFPVIERELTLCSEDVVYELGSGDGSFLVWCAARNPNIRFVGVERNPVLVAIARWRARKGNLSNVEFRMENLFTTDISSATKLYVYLLNPVMRRLLPKVRCECPFVRVVSLAFVFPDVQPSAVVTLSEQPGRHGEHLLYVYDDVCVSSA